MVWEPGVKPVAVSEGKGNRDSPSFTLSLLSVRRRYTDPAILGFHDWLLELIKTLRQSTRALGPIGERVCPDADDAYVTGMAVDRPHDRWSLSQRRVGDAYPVARLRVLDARLHSGPILALRRT